MNGYIPPKRMLRSLLAPILLLSLLLSLCSCVTLRYSFSDLKEESIQAVSFYDLSGAAWRDQEAVLAEAPFYTLPEEQLGAFLKQLKQIKFADTIPLFAASDPSFSYDTYVVCVQFKDGSYKLLSCGGYNETFDAAGTWVSADHYSCDEEQWNDLIYAFAGHHSSRICYHTSESPITVEDHQRWKEILASAKPLDSAPVAEFALDEYTLTEGTRYYMAEDCLPYIKVGNGVAYLEITPAQVEELYEMSKKYYSFWRYNESNTNE